MDVTKNNFAAVFSDITKAIEDADFLAIDGEFTGLDTPQVGHVTFYDTPEERYQKLRKGSTDFLLIQFGLAAFTYDDETKSHTAKLFNFYVFPRPYTRQAPDRRFLCQSSSIDFLASQGFDFNKLFRDGIPYLTLADETQLRETIRSKHKDYSQFSSPAFMSPFGADPGPSKGPVCVPDEHKEFIADVGNKVAKFLEQDAEDTLQLPPCGGFPRKLIYQTIRLKFSSSLHLETKSGEKKERYIVITKIKGEDDMKAKEQAKQNAELNELDDAVGFCKVTRLLSQSGKLIVGHNMLLDVLHLINQFCIHLPKEYEEFKSLTRCVFPRLLDTKLMASTNPLKNHIHNSTLGDLKKILEYSPFTKPKVDLPEEFSRYSGNEHLHEAGYDAYITGLCFISMSNYLGSCQNPPKEYIPPKSQLIEPFINKLFLMRVSDIPYINLSGADLQMSREHVFHITFPKEWKTSDIHELFSPYGNIQISWLDDISAFVSLYKKDNAQAALKGLSAKNSVYRVVTYEAYKKEISPKRDVPVSRKRSSEDVDIDMANKKRKSLNVQLKPAILEDKKQEKNGNNSSGRHSDKKAQGDANDDQGDNKMETGEKLFDESENWD
ncbi:poly(A)-specific ribonuclease PARN-like isoform X2 [Gigantopelta aegis]|uniref:poly(A)-specific ribonuclease PARN-like isoform X2 n=1 Tax=Gigantopelta aegis TaxID=1735272 RepID=UPI001B88C46B|nr:poly(A)-specific ribonuclease PARN-like isoform X2 [Gigantopelta aegis]